jgi:hypothetical protein
LIGNLISRAEFDLEDSRRERHAKTLDIAQEEILICIGIYLYERLEKISRTIKSEEQTWQLLFYITINCLRLSKMMIEWIEGENLIFFLDFEIIKDDFNATLKILCEEFSIKIPKKQKRIKKKSQRQIKSNKISEQPIRIHRQRNNTYPYDKQSIISLSEHKIPLSSSLETLYHESNSRKQPPVSCEECPTLSCIRCSSTRTDLGYSSGTVKPPIVDTSL